MILPPLPLALLEGLGTLLFVVFWVAYQVYQATQQQKEEEPIARPRREPQDAGQRAHAEGDGPPQQDLRSEVERFLEQLGQPDEPEPTDEFDPVEADMAPPRRRPIDPFEEPPRRQPSPKPKPKPRVEVAVREANPVAPPPVPSVAPAQAEGSRLGGLSRTHLPESQLAENAATLGSSIARADERIEARLHKKFDHTLGKLDDGHDPGTTTTSKGSGKESSAALRVAEMLATPGGMRDAVVLGEILNRPSDRW